MRRFCFRYAGIIFTISIQNSDFFEPYFDHFKVDPSAEAAGIKIEATMKPKPHAANNTEINTTPDVTLSNNNLTIVHPFYEGTYNVKQDEGTASVSSLFSLMAFIRLIVSVVIIDRGGLAIHSSCILKNNRAHIFSGSSGCGKSTIVKLTDKPQLYSDEITLVRKDESGIFKVYHSPFRSEFHSEPLQPTDNIAGMYFIKQDTSVYIEPLSQTEGLIKLLPNIFFPITERNPYESKIFQLCCDFLSQVEPMIMHFKKDNSFWRCVNE